jgi:hypothetical protein
MSIIDDYRRKLAELGTAATVILGAIADIEQRTTRLKTDVKEIYEQIDDILDMEQKDESSKPE